MAALAHMMIHKTSAHAQTHIHANVHTPKKYTCAITQYTHAHSRAHVHR